MRGRLAPPDPTRRCPHCGGAGPFYASQGRWTWCVTCLCARRPTRATQIAQVTRQREARQRALRKRPLMELTRRQRWRMMREALPAGWRLCTQCELVKPDHAFRRQRGRPGGYINTCKACIRLAYRLRMWQRRQGCPCTGAQNPVYSDTSPL